MKLFWQVLKKLASLQFILQGCLVAQGAQWSFVREAKAPVIPSGRTIATGAWGDYDGDGRPDLYFCGLESGAGELHRNTGQGFARVENSPVSADSASRPGAVWADFDNDGDLDLFTGSTGGVSDLIYINQGDATFIRGSGLPTVAPLHRQSILSSDINSDGFADLFVANGSGGGAQANFIYLNQGNLSFRQVTTNEAASEARPSNGSSFADYDSDGDLDLLVTDALNPNSLFRNDAGTFTKTTSGDLGESTNPQGGNAAAWADFDNDGDLDLFIPTGLRVNLVYRNDGGTMTRITKAPLTNPAGGSFAAAWADFDNDGWLDLIVSQRDSAQTLFRGTGGGEFETVVEPVLNGIQAANGLALADYDTDGDVDVWIGSWVGGPAPSLVRNETTTNHWLRVRLIGTTSNRSGIGAKLRVRAIVRGQELIQLRQIGGFDSAGSQELVAHVGLGDADRATSLRVEWPSGIVQEISDIVTDQTLTVTEPPPSPIRFSPEAGRFINSVQVTLTAVPSGTEIRFTLDGSDPLPTSTHYASPITLSSTTTIKARLFLNGFPASEILSATYVSDPGLTILPAQTLFTNRISVSMSSRFQDVQIHFTDDGSEPVLGSKRYTEPLSYRVAVAIKARAFFNGFPVTEVISASYSRVYSFENDGIDASWRRQYFGENFLTDPRAAADADPDADGSTNLQEFVGGSHPLDPLSGFPVAIRALPEVRFPSIVGQRYRILRRSGFDVPFAGIAELTATSTSTRFVDEEAGVVVNPAFYLVEPVR